MRRARVAGIIDFSQFDFQNIDDARHIKMLLESYDELLNIESLKTLQQYWLAVISNPIFKHEFRGEKVELVDKLTNALLADYKPGKTVE